MKRLCNPLFIFIINHERAHEKCVCFLPFGGKTGLIKEEKMADKGKPPHAESQAGTRRASATQTPLRSASSEDVGDAGRSHLSLEC